MRKITKALYTLLAIVSLALSGCLVVHPHRAPRHVSPGQQHIPPGHARIKIRKKHVHGAHCGHVWRNGRWVSVEIRVRG